MQKKLLLSLATLALTSNFAHATGYIGISSGVVVNTSDNFEIRDYGIYHHQAINNREVPLTLFGGYGFDLRGPFSIAGEAFVTPTLGKLSSSYGDYLRMTYNYGLSFLPGLQVSEHTLAYARLGWIGAHFSNQNSNANGGQFGLGLKTSITQNIDIRAEYAVSSFSVHRSESNPYRANSTVNSDQFSIGLIYRFI